VNGVAFSPDGRLLATADGNGTMQLLNSANGQLVASSSADTGPGGSVNAVAFGPDGRLLATANSNGTVQLWFTVLSLMP
jgi:WD40 repeat protein